MDKCIKRTAEQYSIVIMEKRWEIWVIFGEYLLRIFSHALCVLCFFFYHLLLSLYSNVYVRVMGSEWVFVFCWWCHFQDVSHKQSSLSQHHSEPFDAYNHTHTQRIDTGNVDTLNMSHIYILSSLFRIENNFDRFGGIESTTSSSIANDSTSEPNTQNESGLFAVDQSP